VFSFTSTVFPLIALRKSAGDFPSDALIVDRARVGVCGGDARIHQRIHSSAIRRTRRR
jgi:hypothetical protein|tara:strand:+ start:7159 stop:7332 length:174 start_codon:yes stop_codon:yes gene_type:complete